MLKRFILLVFISYCTLANGQQNLIPNPSFEAYRKVQNEWSMSAEDFDNSTIAWSSPTGATPDLFFRNPTIEFCYRKYGMAMDSIAHKARMLGLILYTSSSKSLNYREYAKCKLIKPLKKDTLYHLSYKVKLSLNSNIAVNNVGIYLSKVNVPFKVACDPLPLKPQLNCEEIISKDCKWTEIAYNFKATDDFEYLIVGNFYNNRETKYDSVKTNYNIQFRAYYYFDDFDLHSIGKIDTPTKVIFNFNDIYNASNIFFEPSKFDLTSNSMAEIDKIYLFLLNNVDKKLSIHGYTDNTGKEANNMILSEKRACIIKKYLVQKGIAEKRLTCIGHGEGNDIKTASLQRKVEFQLE